MNNFKKGNRRRRKRMGHHPRPPVNAVPIQPGDVPSDEALELEAEALEAETQGRFDEAKKDALNLAALQR
ncbi:MAG: hypothetical protein KJZ68_14585, partial [Phycisphaerales bacterium]|nr:hypothetical protein [Phycisphaerales bacterium]